MNDARFLTIHMIQNHAPANLNRDDLGAPKTAWFGGALRARISSQCLKRSIRRSERFAQLCGGIRTRRLAALVANGNTDIEQKIKELIEKLGLTKNVVNISAASIRRLQKLAAETPDGGELSRKFEKELIQLLKSEVRASAPDMALFGRMIESDGVSAVGIEAAAQVAHAISTHECIPEVDYFTAADDVPGEDAGAAHVNEAGFVSACFYKFFAIDHDQLRDNLGGYAGCDPAKLAAHTIAAFLEAAAFTTPSGKQTGYAAFNPPSAILVELRREIFSYSNAFAEPVARDHKNLVAESAARLVHYAHELDKLAPPVRRWLLLLPPNLLQQYDLASTSGTTAAVETFEQLLDAVVTSLGAGSLAEVRQAVLPPEERTPTLLAELTQRGRLTQEERP